jgi:hypothetical protein
MIIKEEKKKITHRFLLPLSISCCYPKEKDEKNDVETDTDEHSRLRHRQTKKKKKKEDDDDDNKKGAKEKNAITFLRFFFLIHRRLL